MIPLYDLNPKQKRPYVTYLIILINVLVYFWESIGSKARYEGIVYEYGFVPARFQANPVIGSLNILTSMFLHGSIYHLGGNMWFLFVFGDNVEDKLGRLKYILLYLLSGVGASFIHFLFNINSSIPAIGASGAISGVLAAYFILSPDAIVYSLIIGYWVWLRPIRAAWFLGLWFIYQLLYALLGISLGIAYWAHVGGFLMGLLLL